MSLGSCFLNFWIIVICWRKQVCTMKRVIVRGKIFRLRARINAFHLSMIPWVCPSGVEEDIVTSIINTLEPFVDVVYLRTSSIIVSKMFAHLHQRCMVVITNHKSLLIDSLRNLKPSELITELVSPNHIIEFWSNISRVVPLIHFIHRLYKNFNCILSKNISVLKCNISST